MSYAEIKHTLNSKVGTSEFKALNELIGGDITALQSLLTSGHVPIVKSVQRGVVNSNSDKNGKKGTVNINRVDSSKTIVILNDLPIVGSDGEAHGAILTSLNSNSFSYQVGTYSHYSNVTGSTYYNNDFSWQVIEFY